MLFKGKGLSECVCVCVSWSGPALLQSRRLHAQAHPGPWPDDATCQAHGIIAFFSFHSVQSGVSTSCTVTVNHDQDVCVCVFLYLNGTPQQQQKQLLHLGQALFWNRRDNTSFKSLWDVSFMRTPVEQKHFNATIKGGKDPIILSSSARPDCGRPGRGAKQLLEEMNC